MRQKLSHDILDFVPNGERLRQDTFEFDPPRTRTPSFSTRSLRWFLMVLTRSLQLALLAHANHSFLHFYFLTMIGHGCLIGCCCRDWYKTNRGWSKIWRIVFGSDRVAVECRNEKWSSMWRHNRKDLIGIALAIFGFSVEVSVGISASKSFSS